MPAVAVRHDQIAELFRNHNDSIVKFLMQRVNCPDTAQDLSQETYIRLLRQEALAHADNLTGYLFKTAERLAIDFIRQHQRVAGKTEIIDESLPCPKIQPESFAILSEQYAQLLQVIASLPTQCRHVLLLRKVDELSYAQIGQCLGISEKTVQRQLVKAMLHCHEKMGNF